MSNQIPASPEEFTDEPAGRMRLLPTTEFAARAAALTTVALPVAMLAASMTAGVPASGVEDVAAYNTTCCPPSNL